MNAYLITNENLSAFDEIYHFKGKDVLSVAGSGDQYFTCKLYGANRVDLFDYNKRARDLFILKFMALKDLSYPEFYKFIMEEKMKNTRTYERLRDFLPADVQYFFDLYYKYFFPCIEIYKGPKYGDGSIIPYFDVDNYYKLQDILSHEELPTFYHESILDLPDMVVGPYDIMLTSNIYGWLHSDYLIESPDGYKSLLNRFPADVIQAHYGWDKYDDFVEAGYKETIIPSIKSCSNHNYVYTYTKRDNIFIPESIAS